MKNGCGVVITTLIKSSDKKFNDIQWESNTHTQPFYGPLSGTIRVSRCQKRNSGLYGARGN